MTCRARILYKPTFAALILGFAVFLASSCSRQAGEAKHLATANQYFDSGLFEKAEIEYRNVIQVEPLNPQATKRLGLIYASEGRIRNAIPFLLKSRELQPTDPEVENQLGLIDLDSGHPKEAREMALSVLGTDPKSPEALLLLAETVTTPKEAEEARALLLNIWNVEPLNSSAQLALGTLDLRQHHIEDAEVEFRRAVSLDPRSSSAFLALGALLWAKKDLAGADTALAAAAKLAPARSPNRLQYAQFKIRTGDPDAAMHLLEAISKDTPDYQPAWLLMAEIDANRKKFKESASLVAKVLSRDSANPEALLLDVRLHLALGENGAAIEELERMQRIYPKFAQVYFQLGQAYLADRDIPKAIGSLNQAIALKSDFTEAYLLLAEANIGVGDFRSARILMQQLEAKHLEIPEALLLLATADRGLGYLDDSLDIYRRLSKAHPNDPETFVLAGLILVQQGKMDAARKEFDNALDVAADYLPAVEQLIALDLSARSYEAALARANAIALKYPKLSAPQLLLAKIFLAQGDSKSAESALLKAIKIQPDTQAAYLLLARLYAATNRQQMALVDLQDVVSKNPGDISALMMIGIIYDQQANYASARDTYEKLLAKNPVFSAALNNLAYLYSEKFDQLDKAFEMAKRARELLPNEPHTTDTLGWILFKRHQYPWALSLLEESAAKLPSEPEVQFHLGMVSYMLGNEQTARVALRRALQINPSFSGNAEAQLCLSVLAINGEKSPVDPHATIAKALESRPGDPIALSRQAFLDERDGNFEKAIGGYQASLQSSPAYVEAALKLATIYENHDSTQKAVELLKASRKLNPSDSSIAHSLGLLAFETRDYGWSVSLLQDAAFGQPDDPKILYDLAWSFYSVGRLNDALTSMRQALHQELPAPQAAEARRFLDMVDPSTANSESVVSPKNVEGILRIEPGYVPALMTLADIEANSNDPVSAAKTYGKVLEQYPDFAPAMRKLIIMDSEKPVNDPKAIEVAAKAGEAFPDDAELEKATGIIAFRTKDFSRAVNLLHMSEHEFVNDPELLYYLGMAQCRLDMRTEGNESLRRALKLNLRADLAAEAERVLALK